VVGVVLNLAVWFALHTLFTTIAEHRIGPLRLLVPDGATLDPAALTLALAAAVATFRFHAPMLATLAGSAAAGALWHFAR
jgi:chromate transporter